MKVSVITPCFNHGKYIPEMLDSVFCQTFRDFEIIIVNDGSTDGTAAILDSIRHERVRIYHTKHRGPAAARNMAIRKAKGEIILNLDADDKIAPAFLEKCVEIMDTRPDTGIVYADCEFFGAKTGTFVLPPYSLETMLSANCIIANACFRRKDWAKTSGYSDALTYGYEDFDFWLSVIELGREVYHIREPLVFYRAYDNPDESRSGRRKKDSDKVQVAIVQAFRRHRELYARVPPIYERFRELEESMASRSADKQPLSPRNGFTGILNILAGIRILKNRRPGDIVTAAEPPDNLWQEWNGLLRNGNGGNLFLTAEWTGSWLRNMKEPWEEPFFITARKDGRLAGIAPLVIVRGGPGEVIYRLTGQRYSYHLGFIHETEDAARICEALWSHLLDHAAASSGRIEFIHLEEDPFFEAALNKQADARKLAFNRDIYDPCKVIPLAGRFEDYRRTGIVSRNLRHNIRKDLNRVKKEIETGFFRASGDNFREYWDLLLRYHRETMTGRGRNSPLLGEAFPNHLLEVAEAPGEGKEVRLNVLTLGGETAGIILCVICRGTYNALTLGLNPDLIARTYWFNTTVHLILNCIGDAYACGCREFDFLGGPHKYKDDMGGRDRAGIRITMNPFSAGSGKLT